MSTTPGTEWSHTITTSDILLIRCCVGGKDVVFSNDPLGNGRYKITIAGADMKCPGPAEIKDNGTVIATETIAPCP